MKNEDKWRFLLAGVSNMCGATATNPLDVVKIRMQLENELTRQKGLDVYRNRYYEGVIKGGIQIFKDEGFRGLYKGLLPSVMREALYSGIRLGAYEPIKVLLGAKDKAHTPLWKKICAGAVSGMKLHVQSHPLLILFVMFVSITCSFLETCVIGSSIATPTDLVKVRMQACTHGHLAGDKTPRYKNTYSAFGEIIRKEGVKGLYVGVGPTVKRAAILTATQIPSYDHTKHTILNLKWMDEGPLLHIISSMVAGFMAALTTSPVDVVKTRIMNQKYEHHHEKVYKGTFDCLMKIVKTEGFLGLYKGFIPNWMRIGPHTVISFFIFEQLRRSVGMDPV